MQKRKSIKTAFFTAVAMVALTVPCWAETTITGAGATFPYPAYSKWAYNYNQETGVRLNYQSIGSGGGIKQIKAKTVDFGASDAPLKPQELNEAGLMQFPMIMGGVVPVVHLKGIAANQLKLSAENLADIYLGKISKWNDEKIISAWTPCFRPWGNGRCPCLHWISLSCIARTAPEPPGFSPTI